MKLKGGCFCREFVSLYRLASRSLSLFLGGGDNEEKEEEEKEGDFDFKLKLGIAQPRSLSISSFTDSSVFARVHFNFTIGNNLDDPACKKADVGAMRWREVKRNHQSSGNDRNARCMTEMLAGMRRYPRLSGFPRISHLISVI